MKSSIRSTGKGDFCKLGNITLAEVCYCSKTPTHFLNPCLSYGELFFYEKMKYQIKMAEIFVPIVHFYIMF